MAFLLKAMGFGDTVPGFPFTAAADGKAVVLEGGLVPWTVKPGVSDENGKPVTIFTLTLASCSGESKALARNALSLSKRLRLPGVLRCLGGTEYADSIYLAMEPCEPLSTVLASPSRRAEYYGSGDQSGRVGDGDAAKLFSEGVALGLKSIGGALAALHQNDMFHGNVCANAVFVTEAGLWRLWGLELATACGSAASYVGVAQRLVPACRAPPAVMDSLRDPASTGAGSGNPRMLDSYGLGCLVYESLVLTKPGAGVDFAARRSLQLEEIRQGRARLPPTLQPSFARLMDVNAKTQYTVAQFMETCSFINDSDYVGSLEELEELALWDQSRRDRFMDRLARDIPRFPSRVCATVILAKLMEGLRMNLSPASVAAPVLAIAQRVHDEEEFNRLLTPALITLFQSPDRALRYRLLQSAEMYGGRIATKPLSEQMWPHFANGFKSPAGNIREYTARALVTLAPRLSPHIMGNEVPQLLQALQQDPDGTIRANATISLCLIAEHIPEGGGQRAKTLVVGFGRMLKDPFLPSRLAALNSLHATLDHVPVRLMAEMLVPGLAPVMMDTEAEARQMALTILTRCVEKLQAHHDTATRASAAAAAASSASAAPGSPARSENGGGGLGWTGSTGGAPSSSLSMSSAATPQLWSPPKHADPIVKPSPEPARVRAAPTIAVRAPTTTATTMPPTTTTTTTAAVVAKCSSGWSDDEDADEDWGPAPTAAAVALAPVVPPKPMARRVGPSTPTGPLAGASSMSLSGEGGPRARKKVGGLGASRVD